MRQHRRLISQVAAALFVVFVIVSLFAFLENRSVVETTNKAPATPTTPTQQLSVAENSSSEARNTVPNVTSSEEDTALPPKPADSAAENYKSHANTRYVATTGSDSADGSLSKPWRTIQHALDESPNDTLIRVAAGTYREDPNIKGKSRITLVGDTSPDEKPHIIGVKYYVTLHVTNSSYITVDNFKIEGTPQSTDTNNWGTPFGINNLTADVGEGVHHLTIRNNELIGPESAAAGIQSSNKGGAVLDYITIENNVIHGKDGKFLGAKNNVGPSAISMFTLKQLDRNPGPHIVIRRNFIYQIEQQVASTGIGVQKITDGNGIIFDYMTTYDYKHRVDVYLNIVASVGGSGGHSIYSNQEANFYNNTIVDFARTRPTPAIGTQTEQQRVWNNLIIGDDRFAITNGPGTIGDNLGFKTVAGSETIGSDPLLADPFSKTYSVDNYRPKPASPVGDLGVASFNGVDSPTEDFFGKPQTKPWLGAIAP